MTFDVYVIKDQHGNLYYIGEGRTGARVRQHRRNIKAAVEGRLSDSLDQYALYKFCAEKVAHGAQLEVSVVAQTQTKGQAVDLQDELIVSARRSDPNALPFNRLVHGCCSVERGELSAEARKKLSQAMSGVVRGPYASKRSEMDDELKKLNYELLRLDQQRRKDLGEQKTRFTHLGALTNDQARERRNKRAAVLREIRKAEAQDRSIDQFISELYRIDRSYGVPPVPYVKHPWSHQCRPRARLSLDEERDFIAPYVSRGAPVTEIARCLAERLNVEEVSAVAVYAMIKRHGFLSPRNSRTVLLNRASRAVRKLNRAKLAAKLKRAETKGRIGVANLLRSALAVFDRHPEWTEPKVEPVGA